MSRQLRRIVGAVALSMVVAGCGPGPGGPDGGGGVPESWTILVYMVADNNLEPFGVADLLEMADATAGAGNGSPQVRFVVQADRAAGYSSQSVGTLGNWESTRRLVVRNGGFEPVSDLGELNMGDPGVLSDFIQWGMGSYPADRYMLVFWDHGAGWPGFGGDNSTPTDDLLTLTELNSGLQAGLGSGPRLEIIGYDACLMATYEVAKTMQPYAKYLLASEELEPGTGWDYRSFSALLSGATVTPAQLGKEVVDGFMAHSDAINQGQDATLSLTDLGTPLDAVTTAVASYVTAANGGIQAGQATATAISQQRVAAVKFGDMPDPARSVNHVDFGDLVTRLAGVDSARFATVATQVQTALGSAVVYKRGGPLRASATGLSIYFPPSADYYQSAYDSVAAASTWRGFLGTYFQAATGTYGTVTTPEFVSGALTTQVLTADAALWFYMENALTPASAPGTAMATLTYGVKSTAAANTYILVGDKPAGYEMVNSPAAWGYWNRTLMGVWQGSDCGATSPVDCRFGYIYLSGQQTPSGGDAYTLPFAYQESASAPAQYAVRQLVFDSANTLVEDAYYLESPGGWGELVAVPGAKLWPLLQIFDSTGLNWGYGTDGDFEYFDPMRLDTLQFGTFAVNSGTTLYGILEALDFGGYGDAVGGEVVNP
ncbi:MAG: clostripain-related cysteine peptidase [Myxococcota bacterium]|nr:clostripain-related cysteine peptidase [Myxococcota bacterium]